MAALIRGQKQTTVARGDFLTWFTTQRVEIPSVTGDLLSDVSPVGHTRKQVETWYPGFAEFLRLKKKYDPEERFQSDWYRHYRRLFADRLSITEAGY